MNRLINHLLKCLFLGMTLILVFAACDPMEGDFETIKELMGGGKPKVTPKVYVAGYYVEGGAVQACYWVDGGDPIPLNGGFGAKAITVAGGKVYAAGTYGSPYPDKGCYWADGVKNDLSNSTDAFAIAYSNGDVYTAGILTISSKNYPCYWKNRTFIPIDDSNYIRVSGMAVSGDDVYVVGTTDDGKNRICYWKNGSDTPVTFLKDYQDEHEYESSWACDIAISNNIIYVAGMLHDGSSGSSGSYFYWKENNEPVFLGSDQGVVFGDYDGTDLAITVSKGRVYVAGTLRQRVGPVNTYYACYWVDGVDIVLTDGHSAYSIAVLDDVVYVAGIYEDSGELKACYWVNGERIMLPGGTSSRANAIAVVYE